MEEIKLSEGEKFFLIHGINNDFRVDGRHCFDRRDVELKLGLIASCDGSSQVRCGDCHVIVSIKLNVHELEKDEACKGKMEFFADISANANPAFEGRGGENLATEITSLFQYAFQDIPFLDDLIIIDGKSVWCIFVDLLVLEIGSKATLFDSCSIAVKAALFNTKIPKIIVDSETNEIELSDDVFDVTKIDTSCVPIFLTLTRVSNRYIIDATTEEELSSISSILFAINNRGEVLHMKKIGVGSLHKDPIKEVLESSQKLSLKIHEDINSQLNEMEDTSILS